MHYYAIIILHCTDSLLLFSTGLHTFVEYSLGELVKTSRQFVFGDRFLISCDLFSVRVLRRLFDEENFDSDCSWGLHVKG